MRWIGAGCTDYGVLEGAALSRDDLAKARALMDGVDWRTNQRLVAAKVEAAPAAKLRGASLLDAILLEAARRGVEPQGLFETPRERDLFGRLERGVRSRGELYAMHFDLVGYLADAAGIHVLGTYGDAFMDALAHRDDRIDVRNRGYDIALTLPKSFSVLMAYAPPELARELERDVFDVAAHDTLRYLEAVASYGMRGHHGDGRNAERIESAGFVGWSLVHRASRAGDPHHHVHLNIANMIRGLDGKWSAPGAGGRDLMRHTHAAGAFMEARVRHLLSSGYGIETARSERSGQWEIVGIPDSTLRLFSKRDNDIRAFLGKLGIAWEDASEGQRRTARDITREAKDRARVGAGDDVLRAGWQDEGRAHGDDPRRTVAAVLDRRSVHTPLPDLDAVAARVFDPDTGLTADRKSFDRAAAFAAVLENLPTGVPDLFSADAIADAILGQSPQVIGLPATGPRHMSDIARWTTIDIVAAEQTILSATRTRMHEGTAVVAEPVAEMALSAYEAGKGHALSAEQRAAYHRIVGGGHGIDALIGVAGSGKTTIMEAARLAWESAGYSVTGASLAAVAAQNLQAQAGIASTTIASLLQGNARLGDVLIIDEAAMVDERRMSAIVSMAGSVGTKVVGIGDPKQLRAAGVGGSFAHVHDIVGGLTLSENRRQLDPAERAATALMRDAHFTEALQGWADRGRIQVGDTREDAMAAMIAAWAARRTAYNDPHSRLREVVMIAYTNADVEALNLAARALLQATGELPPAERTYRLVKADELRLAVGDVVRVRQNLWSPQDAQRSLLNGNRGIVSAIRPDGDVLIAWRTGANPVVRESVVSTAEIARGALSHGYAITDHAAQGQTADVALVYPIGMDANAAYPAVTRHRDQLHLFIPLDQVEDELATARLGPVLNDNDRIARGVEGWARSITVRTEEMVSLELGLEPTPQSRSQLVPVPMCPVVETTDSHRELRAVVQAAATYYAAQPIPGWVEPYCTARGSDLDSLPRGAGYAPSGWRNLTEHLRAAGFTDEQLLASGLVSRSSRGELIDRMRDRLVLPIHDQYGPVAFIGRAAPYSDAPKWLNTSDSALFSKGGLLYGLADSAQALRAGATPVVVEGPFDAAVVNAAGGGRYVGVAPLGTALTQRHVQALVEVVGSGADIVVGFDADPAGTAAAVRSYDLLAPHTDRARQLTLPDGNDPADFLAARGPAALRSALDDATLLVEQVVEARIRPWDSKLRFAEGRIGALREAAPLIAALPPEQVPGQVHRLMQRLDLAHETVIDAIVEAIPNITSAATTAQPQARRRRDVDLERAQSRATRSHANTHEPRPGIGI